MSLTSRRPLGSHELYWAQTRGPRGRNDIYAMAVFDSPKSHPIPDDIVINAWALVRMRHPALAARIVTQPAPELICTAPATLAQALEEATTATSIRTFHSRDAEEAAVFGLVQSIDSNVAMDMSAMTARIFFSRGVGVAAGQFLLAVEFVHSVADGRGEMKVLRQMLQAFARPAEAAAELLHWFASPPLPPKLPECLDNLMPDLSSYHPAERQRGKAAYDQLTEVFSGMDLSGLISDSTPRDDPTPRILIHIWSPAETERILASCQRRALSITAVIAAAMALAALHDANGRLLTVDGKDSNTDAPPRLFAVNTAVDLASRLQPSVRSDNIAARVRSFAAFLQLHRVPHTKEERTNALWDLAAQYREHSSAFIGTPYLWQFLQYSRPFAQRSHQDRLSGKPHLPYLSNIGNITPFFPPYYAVTPQQADKEAPGIKVVNMHLSGKMPEGAIHVWSYNGKLHMQLTYSYETYWSSALMGSYLHRIVDLVTEAEDKDIRGVANGARQNDVTNNKSHIFPMSADGENTRLIDKYKL